jgi:hypothetical protein
MSILALWKTSPNLLQEKTAKQIIAISGDGKLTDGGVTSSEFRALLSEVPSTLLAKYATNCLEESFPDSGMVLQDIVNEMGTRLGLRVEHGRYRGRAGLIGNDGLWTLPTGHKIVVEVKTTDAYRIDLNVISGYRTELIRTDQTSEKTSSALIVVGRIDTGDLEAQIRGSRFAWSMRLLSVDSLIRLVQLKESLEDPESMRRIHDILIPREFTKLDGIVDLVFSTAEDVKSVDDEPISRDSSSGGRTEKKRNTIVESAVDADIAVKLTPVAFNDQCAARIGASLSIALVKRSRALYSSPDDSLRVVCLVSKAYAEGKADYWYGFHPHQRETLAEAKNGYVAFGCGSPELTILMPFEKFLPLLDGMNTTNKDGRYYWHVQIYEEGGKLILLRKKGQTQVSLEEFRIR